MRGKSSEMSSSSFASSSSESGGTAGIQSPELVRFDSEPSALDPDSSEVSAFDD